MNIDNIIILEQADYDIEYAKQFYNLSGINVGDYFFDCIMSDIESLAIYAGIHNKHFGLYRMLSKRFPYAIYYDIAETTILVIAVLDLRSNPTSIRNKLTQ
jgi:hypothetical protein